MRKKNPISVMNLSFLDIITAASGVFFFLVIIVIISLHLTTDLAGKNEIALLFSNIKSLNEEREYKKDSSNTVQDEIKDITSKKDSAYYFANRISYKELSIAKKKGIVGKYQSEIKDVEIDQNKLNVTSEILMDGKFFRPAISLEDPPNFYNRIVFLKKDTIYVYDSQNFNLLRETETVRVLVPQPGAYELLNDAIKPNSNLNRSLNSLSNRSIVLLKIYPSSAEYYSEFRDFLIQKGMRISLQFENGNVEVRFSKGQGGTNPRPQYNN